MRDQRHRLGRQWGTIYGVIKTLKASASDTSIPVVSVPFTTCHDRHRHHNNAAQAGAIKLLRFAFVYFGFDVHHRTLDDDGSGFFAYVFGQNYSASVSFNCYKYAFL